MPNETVMMQMPGRPKRWVSDAGIAKASFPPVAALTLPNGDMLHVGFEWQEDYHANLDGTPIEEKTAPEPQRTPWWKRWRAHA